MAIPEATAIVEAVAPERDPEEILTPRERAAYHFTLDHPQPPLSPSTQAKLFTLFLQGTDCIELARLNPGITLGQIVVARMQAKWDEKRQEHIDSLLQGVRLKVQQVTLEGVDFIALQLAAAHKLHGEKIKRYLQTGDENELGGFSIHGWKGYREAVETLKLLTGQDGKGKQTVTGEIVHRHEMSEAVPPSNRPMKNDEARSAIAGALATRRKP